LDKKERLLESKYKLVVIEGNIGAGKTTLSKSLAETFQAQLLLESFEENPFLKGFYENPERYAFPVELFFMTERHKQLQTHLMQPSLFHPITITDYFFGKTLLFAANNLEGAEFRLFKNMFEVLNSTFPEPDLMIYIHRPIDQLIKNINQRGRSYELQIQEEYLLKIQKGYFNYINSRLQHPILLIEADDRDLLAKDGTYDFILQLFSREFGPGITSIALPENKKGN
jgi:deoxyguanosine kinase